MVTHVEFRKCPSKTGSLVPSLWRKLDFPRGKLHAKILCVRIYRTHTPVVPAVVPSVPKLVNQHQPVRRLGQGIYSDFGTTYCKVLNGPFSCHVMHDPDRTLLTACTWQKWSGTVLVAARDKHIRRMLVYRVEASSAFDPQLWPTGMWWTAENAHPQDYMSPARARRT